MPDNMEEKNPSEALSNDEIQALFDELKSLNLDDDNELGLPDLESSEPDAGGSIDEMDLTMPEIGDISPEIDNAIDELLKNEEVHEELSELDRQLMEAMEFNKEADEDDFLDESEVDFINNVSIYDTEDRSGAGAGELTASEQLEDFEGMEGDSEGEEPQEQAEPTKFQRIWKKAETVPVKRMYIVAGVLVAVIIVLGVSAFTMMGKLQAAVKACEDFMLTMPQYSSNSSNYIYRNDIFVFGEQEYKLTKMLMDSSATMLYFDGYFDLSTVKISLWDDDGLEYSRDLGYVPPNEFKDMNPTTVVRFRPFKERIKGFNIKIEQQQEELDIHYFFKNALTFPPIVYTGKKISEDRENGAPRITVENAFFSTAGTVAEVSINWAGEGHMLQLGHDGNNESIILEESGRRIMPRFTIPRQYIFPKDRKLLIRTDFDPVSGFDGKLNLTFKNLFKVYQMNLQMPPGELFMNTTDKYREYKLDNYKLSLERFFYGSDKAVLVFNVQDTSIPKPVTPADEIEDPYYNRVEGQLDVELTVETADGDIWQLKGVTRSGPIGSDVIFQLPDGKESAEKILPNKISLSVNSALIKMEDITLEINPKYDGVRQEMPAHEAAREAITEFFNSRLGYKMGDVKIGAVQGFSREILADGEIMKNYAPGSGENMDFDVQVIALSLEENSMNCVVKEMWRDKTDGTFKTQAHQVKALADSKGWVIVEDEIVE